MTEADLRSKTLFREAHGTESHNLLAGTFSVRGYSSTDLGIVVVVFVIGYLLSRWSSRRNSLELQDINKVFKGLQSTDT